MKPGVYVCVILLLVQCASLQRYGADRAADFGDILTVGAEAHSYGVQAKLGPLNAGLNYSARARGFGLRAGSAGHYRPGAVPEGWSLNGSSLLVLNSSYHDSGGACAGEVDKAYRQSSVSPFVLYEFEGYNGFFQFEAGVGLFGGLRVGLNLAEAFDFLAGLLTIDPFGDDC